MRQQTHQGGGSQAAILYGGGYVPVDGETIIAAVARNAKTAARPDWDAEPWLAARDLGLRFYRLPSAALARPEVVELERGVQF